MTAAFPAGHGLVRPGGGSFGIGMRISIVYFP
jgi:hypothetical protein